MRAEYPLDRRVKVTNGIYKGFEGIVVKKSPTQVFVEMTAAPAESDWTPPDKPVRKWLPTSFVLVEDDEPDEPESDQESGEKSVTRTWTSYEVTALFDTDNPNAAELFATMVQSLHVLGGIRDLEVETRVVEETD